MLLRPLQEWWDWYTCNPPNPPYHRLPATPQWSPEPPENDWPFFGSNCCEYTVYNEKTGFKMFYTKVGFPPHWSYRSVSHLLSVVVFNLEGDGHCLFACTNKANNMWCINLQLAGVVDAQVVFREFRGIRIATGWLWTHHLSQIDQMPCFVSLSDQEQPLQDRCASKHCQAMHWRKWRAHQDWSLKLMFVDVCVCNLRVELVIICWNTYDANYIVWRLLIFAEALFEPT